jgi:hypothetical protein
LRLNARGPQRPAGEWAAPVSPKEAPGQSVTDRRPQMGDHEEHRKPTVTKTIELDIPDVPAPTNPFLGYWGSQLVIGHFLESSRIITLSSTFVRCVFSAREDYLAATKHLCTAFQSAREMQLSELYRSIARFESCIRSMYLAERAFVRLRRCDELSAESAAMINHEKPAFIAPTVRGRLKAARDTMEHIEELLAKGKLTEDLPYMVQPTGEEHPRTDLAQLADTVVVIDRLRIG